MSESEQRAYAVTGMSCEHCVAAVSAEVGEIPGVSEVVVDLTSGTVLVSGRSVDAKAVQLAVEEAGYSLTGHA
jgi:copper ion binding protein